MTYQPQRGSLLAGARTLASALFTLGRSYRRFEWQTAEDERHVAKTSDGWDVALYRYWPRGTQRPFPVVCGHGMAGSRMIYDLHPDYSLARHLAGRGFDTWLIDFRGRGSSWPEGTEDRSLQWTFDDFVEHDFPAALECVTRVTGVEECFWIGMEMSGQVLYAAAIQGIAGQVRGAITCGSPVLTPVTAKVPGVNSPPKGRRKGRVQFKGGASIAGPVLAYGGSRVLESSFRPCNTDPIVVARYFRNGVPDESVRLVDQFAGWIREGVMQNDDGSLRYSNRLSEIRLPLLVIAAAGDLQRPADSVRAAYEAFGSGDKTFVRAGVDDGFSVDFGHDDLLAGIAAPAEVFPRVTDWLVARSGTG